MKKVIINADDFGLIQSVNEGIIQAHREGVLSSASLMANTPGFEHAVKLAGQNKELGVGVHLNILRGKPLSERRHVQSLITTTGIFSPSLFRLYRRIKTRRIDISEVERELRAQIEKVMNAGIVPSHLDSEKHSHMIGPLFSLALKLAKDYRIAKIRFVREHPCTSRPVQLGKLLFISLSGSILKKRMTAAGIKSTDHFYGICDSGRMTAEKLQKSLLRLKDGITEIMVHPGFISKDLIELEKTFGSYYINRFRELELKALLDDGVKKTLADRGIRLMSFHHL